jgi:biopolymer transport protein ExbD
MSAHYPGGVGPGGGGPGGGPGQPFPAQGGGGPPGGGGRLVPKASIVKYKAALRKAIRRNAREPEIDFLNITAMLDLMTIILVFVLKTIATSSAAIPQSEDLTIPVSVMTSDPAQEGVVVMISKTQLIVGDDPKPIVEYSSREQLAQTGLDAKHKRSGPNDLYIVPLAKVLADYRDIDKQVRVQKGMDPGTSEAIIVADQTTPYRLLIEVLYTLGQSEFGKYHLMVMSASSAGGGK